MLPTVVQSICLDSSVHRLLAAAVHLSPFVKVHSLLDLAVSTVRASKQLSNNQRQLHVAASQGSQNPQSWKLPAAAAPLSHMLETRRTCRWLSEVNKASISPSIGRQEVQTSRSAPSEVKMESQLIFDGCWRRFEEKYRLKNVQVPREVVWLNGAPGAGKGVNTYHILKTRGLETSICMSTMLNSHPESQAFVDRGDMIPDSLVGDMLLEALLIQGCRAPECGVLVDGFPRTSVQVDFLKLLFDKLMELHTLWANTAHEHQFPRPLFKVVMLYVDEETSIKRQLERAQVASLHNKRVIDAGAGDLWEQRSTDLSIEKCKKRYQIFRSHYGATLRLKQFLPFHLIDAMGNLEETQEAISLELRYQSSLDLSEGTYSAIRHLPLSRDLSQYARQQLVSRLDDHCQKHPNLFQKVIDIVTVEIMPALRESGMSGRVEYVCDMRLFNDHPRAAQMLLDILTDRGFSASHTTDVAHVPMQVDLATGQIKNRKEYKHRFIISWDTKGVREMAKALELAEGLSDTTKDGVRISQSFIPINQERKTVPRKNGNGHGMNCNGNGNGECEDGNQVIHGS